MAIGKDQVARVRVVELVDLVGVVDDRHIPSEQVDEHRLSGGEHRAEHRVGRRPAGDIEGMQHGSEPFLA